MSTGFFAALRNDDDDSSSDDGSHNNPKHGKNMTPPPAEGASVTVPAYEDLSFARMNEETALKEIYGADFSAKIGVWNCPCWTINVRPQDLDPKSIGTHLQLQVQLGKKYPYVVPKIDLQNITGLSPQEEKQLRLDLQERAAELAQSGTEMMFDLVQVTQDFLFAHNRDPNMSAWEQMKEREKNQRIKANEANEALNQIMENEASAVAFDDTSGRRAMKGDVGSEDVERELLRQREAFEKARKERLEIGTGLLRRTSSGTHQTDTEDDFEIDLDYNPASVSASRYETDFIEMGILGAGGGGEVVKARNRLDGRIYAIKKIILEREDGAMAKIGALQNQKLRREVTTISRMTHNNIVRYYQAWVEGDGKEDEGGSSTTMGNNDHGFEPSTNNPVRVIEEGSDEESDSSQGWWTSIPDTKGTDTMDVNLDESESQQDAGTGGFDMESDSAMDLFKDDDFGLQSPLMTGLGFQNNLYGRMTKDDDSSSKSESVEEESSLWEESAVKVGSGVKGRKILYIQMEFCSTTLRELIDQRKLEKMKENEIWRLIKQITEALAYIHSRKLIHRDLKPGNIFVDGEGNIRLGDFGLATKHKDKEHDRGEHDDDSEASSLYHAIEDISRLMGGSKSKETRASKDLFSPETSNANESMTGGVGTTFYRAPEQEASVKRKKGEGYTVQADIFSLGVVLFEMFQPPFGTYMERAENLTRVRGDHAKPPSFDPSSMTKDELDSMGKERFSDDFRQRVPENAQRLILWCLSRDPRRRPSASDILKSNLLPGKLELEQRYLSEALQLLTSSQSESYIPILDALFKKPVKDIVAVTYDTDIAVKATNVTGRDGKRSMTPSEALLRAVSGIRSGAVDLMSISSLAMSDSSLVAAAASLNRSSNTGKLGKGGRGMLKRATHRTAGVLAMRAATAAAVTGAVDGVHGADPTVLENICNQMKQFFVAHGAVRLRSPLLRPRIDMTASSSGGGPAELLNTRGVVLVLPEDLTVNFARSIGRGGAATSNIKRYDIDRVYHKSLAGGHPRETLEASFDIVHENHGSAIEIYTEALLVGSKVMELLPPSRTRSGSWDIPGPTWFVRLNHTRLADAILDLCFVPAKEPTRRAALTIIGRFTAPTVYTLKHFLMKDRRWGDLQQSKTPHSVEKDRFEELIEDAEKNHGLPHEASLRIRRFIHNCGVLSPKGSQSIDRLKEAIAKLRSTESSKKIEPKLIKRFEDAARSLKSLRDVIAALETYMKPLVISAANSNRTDQTSPLFLSIDLALRQRRKHYHGGLIFQYIVLPEGFLGSVVPDESNEALMSSGVGVKVAEGGEFSELVRRYRPPGNFASTFLSRYTTSPIPFCCGIRFSVGKLVELCYVNAVYGNDIQTDFSGPNDVTQMRKLLGHPLAYSESVCCIVASVHGMDSASAPERFSVARVLWSAGISAEYLPHSGIMLSLLKRIRDESTAENASASDWSLVELYGVCALLKIPFVVIVQPHLLRDKKSVRLRRINCDTSSNPSSTGEIFVSLDNLVSTIREDAAVPEESGAADEGSEAFVAAQTSTTGSTRSSIDCIYVDNDSYFGMDREVTKSETPHWKVYLKSIKKIQLSAEAFVESLREAKTQTSVPVFAVADASFWALRDFGTNLMRREHEQSANGAYADTADRYPKHKRALKTLSSAIDTYMRRNGVWLGNSSSSKRGNHSHGRGEKQSSELLTLLLYSKQDDRFDVITLSLPHQSSAQSNHSSRRR